MICEYCKKKIKKDEGFYEIYENFYCRNCVIEKTVMVYKINNGEICEEEDVNFYNDNKEYIKILERRRNNYLERLEKGSNLTEKKKEYLELGVKHYEALIKQNKI